MKKNVISRNYLDGIPVRNSKLSWSQDEAGIVTLEIQNTGFFNKIAHKFFGRPSTSYVHLDETGSFIWPMLDGDKDIIKIGESVKEHFGKMAEPLYERLATYFKILESYNFIYFK